MSDYVELFAPSPDEKDTDYYCKSGTHYRVSRFVEPVIDILRDLPIMDLLEILGITDHRLEDIITQKKARLCDKALKYIKDVKWCWRITGEAVTINTEFVQDHLGQDVTKQTVYRRLRERRMTLTEVRKIIDFFEDDEITELNKSLV